MLDNNDLRFLNSLQRDIVLELRDLKQVLQHSAQRYSAKDLFKDMTPQIVQALIQAINSLVALIQTDQTNAAALQAAKDKAEADLAALQQTDAALQDPALVDASNAAIAAAAAALPAPAPAA